MPTMIKIATITVGAGGAASIDFTSIPATYTDLVLVCSLRTSGTSADSMLKFNGLGTNQTQRTLRGLGTGQDSITSTEFPGLANEGTTSTASVFSSGNYYIPNYLSANFKSFGYDGATENNASAAYLFLAAGLWSAVAAINQITLTPGAGTFVQYSSATLFGIKSS